MSVSVDSSALACPPIIGFDATEQTLLDSPMPEFASLFETMIAEPGIFDDTNIFPGFRLRSIYS